MAVTGRVGGGSSNRSLGRLGAGGSSSQGFTSEELEELLRKQGQFSQAEEPKAGFLQRLSSLLRVGETAEANIRSVENGTSFLSNYKDTALERLSSTFSGKLTDKPDRTYSDFLEMKGWVNEPGKLDLTDFAGFVGDVLLDPTTYLTLGTGSGIKVATKTGLKTLTREAGERLTTKIGEGLTRDVAEKAVLKELGETAFKKKAVRLAGIPIAPLRQGDPLIKLGVEKIPILRNVYDTIGKSFKWDYKPIGVSYESWAKRIKATEKYRTVAQSAKPLTRLEIDDWIKDLDPETSKQVTSAIEQMTPEFGEEASTAIVQRAVRGIDKSGVSRLAERAVQLDTPKVAELFETQKQLAKAKPDDAIDLQKRLFQLADDSQLQDELASVSARTESGEMTEFVAKVEQNIADLDDARLGGLLEKLESKALYSELGEAGQRAAQKATELAFGRQKAFSRAGISVGDLSLEDFMVGGYIAHVPTKEYTKFMKKNPELRRFVTGTADKVKSRTLKGSASSINDDFKLARATSEYLRNQRKDLADPIIQTEFDNLMTALQKGTDAVDPKLKDDLGVIRENAEKIPDMFETDIRVIAEAMGVSEKTALAKRQLLNDLHKVGEPVVQVNRIVNGEKQVAGAVEPGFAQIQTIPGLGHLQFPEPIAKSIDEFGEDFFRKKQVNDLVKGFDKLQNFYKGSLTSLFPSFHGRNVISNVLNSSLDNGMLALRPDIQKHAVDLALGRNLDKTLVNKVGEEMTLKQLQEEGMKRGIIGTDFFRGEIGVDPTFKTKLSQANVIKQGQRLGTKIEDQAKWSMFVDNFLRGQNLDVAASKVKEYLFDYGQLTSFEKNIMRRVIPFYTWSRKNATLQARQIMENPGKYATVFKAARSLSVGGGLTKEEYEDLPPWLKNSLVLKVGKDEYGAPRYIAGLGLPIEEFTETGEQVKGFLKTITGTGVAKDREEALQLLGRTAFIPKAIMERVANVDFFTSKKMTEVTNANSAVALTDNWFAKHLINDEMRETFLNWLEVREIEKPIYKNGKVVGTRKAYEGNPDRLALLRQIPTSRFQSTLGRAKEFAEKGEAFDGEQILNFTTGMKSYVVDPETQEYFRERDLQERLQEQLIRLGVLKEFTNVYIPKKSNPNRSPEEFLK